LHSQILFLWNLTQRLPLRLEKDELNFVYIFDNE
jgi:hypothetical protein